ncbi:MAG TPA: hypothetical protein VFO79_02380 [Xanthomonadales bacterium]|nr:hypothetical protein [Xanthomonadales bacterium]
MIPMLLALLTAAAATDPCEPPRGRNANPCAARVGHCFDVAIDGQATERLEDAALRAELEQATGYDVCWVLPRPTASAADIKALANAHTERIGPPRAPLDIVVYALQGQQIPTKKGIRTDPTVRIGGVAMQTVVDVIDMEGLPDGAYAVKVRYVGTKNYDQQVVLLEVRRADADATKDGRSAQRDPE